MASQAQPTGERPRFRQDLFAEAVDDQVGRFIDVMDPDSGSLFRFYEVEFSLACAMDGSRDVAGLVKWAQEELGMTPSMAEVRSVISTLGDLGYLERGEAERAAAAAGGPELVPGVVVGPRPAAAASDVALGVAGARPVTPAELPKAPDVALGAPGASGRPRAPAPVEDMALGVPGRAPAPPERVSDVSLDLADQMVVRPDDVKEAVRASKVIQAVDVPRELLDYADEQGPGRPAPLPPPLGGPAIAATAVPPVQPPFSERPLERAVKPAVELPRPPVVQIQTPAPPIAGAVQAAQQQKKVPPAPGKRVSPVLIVLLILVLGGGLAFIGWKYLIDKSNEDGAKDQTIQTTPPAPAPPPVTPPPAPPPPVKLAVETAPPLDIKAAIGAQVEWVHAAKPAKAGDVIARLVGHAPLVKEITNNANAIEKRIKPDIATLEKDLAAAQAGNKPAAAIEAIETKLEDRKKALADRQATVAAKKLELDKYLVKAPIDGEVKPVAKPARIAAGGVLVTITPPTTLVATFRATEAAPPVDSLVYVAVKDSADKLTCRVTRSDKDSVTVGCPGDASLGDREVTLAGAAPADGPQPEIEMLEPDGSDGAGSGSAAAPGGAAPAPGSAAVPDAAEPPAKGAPGSAAAPGGAAAAPPGKGSGTGNVAPAPKKLAPVPVLKKFPKGTAPAPKPAALKPATPKPATDEPAATPADPKPAEPKVEPAAGSQTP